MTMYNYSSLVLQKSPSTNAHLGRRVAAHHSKVYIYSFINEIAILNPDKTLICSQNARHSIGFPIRKKGRSLPVNTNLLFDEIIEQMALSLIDRSCINDYQWRIGVFLTDYLSMHLFLKKIRFTRPRNKKINFFRGSGSNQRPDRVVIMNANKESSVILGVDRLQIPIVSLVDSNIPLGLSHTPPYSPYTFRFHVPANIFCRYPSPALELDPFITYVIEVDVAILSKLDGATRPYYYLIQPKTYY